MNNENLKIHVTWTAVPATELPFVDSPQKMLSKMLKVPLIPKLEKTREIYEEKK